MHIDTRQADHVTRLEQLSSSTRTIVLAGPGGAGKAHLAKTWLAQRSADGPPLVLDAADLGHDWASIGKAALTQGRSVVIRHLEDLPPAAFNTVKSFARRLRDVPEHDPIMATDLASPRLVFTVDNTVAVPLVIAFASQLAPIFTVSALVARRDELPRLIRELVDERPAADRITFSAAAMQALLRWDWPGNAAELRTTVHILCATHPGRVVQIGHLPDAIQARARNMTTIEALERDAILAALRRSGGNRSAAAAALGIGRTTLYRKLASLGIDGAERLSS